MNNLSSDISKQKINTFDEFLEKVDYALMDSLNKDPKSTIDGNDHLPREVLSGHYVPVKPTPITSPKYISHSIAFFNELGLSNKLVQDEKFVRLFSGDISCVHKPMRSFGWATGYALSIYGKEYNQQCPFGTGNGYGDGRAISVFQGVFNGKRWEMQLKGGGQTPYCRGADGKAILRSSIREFLAQEYMHALGVPTTRSLTIYVSQSETVMRPWYTKNTRFINPDIMVDSPVAITTRVAHSFLRIGQLELFARRVRNDKKSLNELKKIIKYLIKTNYKDEINTKYNFDEQIVLLADLFRQRIIYLVTNWIRVGYCQGNFNSDNTSLAGITLDYGPFGFCEMFDPKFQPWIGGGEHFSFFNQPAAAEANYQMFLLSLRPLLKGNKEALEKLDYIQNSFSKLMKKELNQMWTNKLGLEKYDEALVTELFSLMTLSNVDYTRFFRKLSFIPKEISSLKSCFYSSCSEQVNNYWNNWLKRWEYKIKKSNKLEYISKKMKLINPKYTWREWIIADVYEKSENGDYSSLYELQKVLSNPYDEQTEEIHKKYDCLRPYEFFNYGGISHYSCSS
tara:strand:+ start:3590 stop:5287 length:1698 start_codon:yes stop_codon:yes gene_type:complete